MSVYCCVKAITYMVKIDDFLSLLLAIHFPCEIFGVLEAISKKENPSKKFRSAPSSKRQQRRAGLNVYFNYS